MATKVSTAGTAVKQPITLIAGGETRTYANDKEGKRQAIVAGLQAIAVITVADDEYLPNDAALQVVAAVLYPEGIQTKEAYQVVQGVTEKACAHVGFGPEEELGPPAVPFSARGYYRKRYPPLAAEDVLAELAQAGVSSAYPRQEVACSIVDNKAGLAVYGRPWSQLTSAEQNRIQAQVEVIAAQAGWQKAESGGRYSKPLPIGEAAARQRVGQILQQENGRPVSARSVIYQAQLGAYGRSFYRDELPLPLQAIVSDLLQAVGYQPFPEDGEYHPQPLDLAADVVARLGSQVAALPLAQTNLGPCLRLRDVLALVRAETGAVTIGDWQVEQLAQHGPLSQVLRQLGYQTELTWCQPYQFQPQGEEREGEYVILKEVRIRRDGERTVALAKGLPVYTPALTIDDVNDTLVYLQMVGAKQAVQANWAALVGGGKVHWFGRKRVQLEGMKAHVKIQATLPCGWVDHTLLHKQASLQAMNPERPFYLLDDGTQPIPPLFYAMLNKALSLPLLAEWAGYLWTNGRERKLIFLLDDGEGQGYAAWRVLPAGDVWQEIVQAGLAGGQLRF